MAPLKNSSNVDDAIVDNIFYMIPEILMHHSVYLDVLDKVWKNWDSKTSTVGNLILNIVSMPPASHSSCYVCVWTVMIFPLSRWKKVVVFFWCFGSSLCWYMCADLLSFWRPCSVYVQLFKVLTHTLKAFN